ncbi:MAG: hypothetical protein JNK15_24790 [Planctomycetes bacterium]|nr:hypothetical protein [Planctomycetota bacterium]
MNGRLAGVLLLTACTVPPAGGRPLAWPARTTNLGGSEWASAHATLPLADREALALQEFEQGNVPSFLRDLVPVTLCATWDGTGHSATVFVTPDYFGIGTDADWLRLPLSPGTAQVIADRLDCVLPTRRIVDAVWQQAAVKVAPHPFSPQEHDIVALPLFLAHHRAVEAARPPADRALLFAGHKKDVVVSPLLAEFPNRVVIYGWHRLDGRPIQPLWKGHTRGHVDYSHGIRFVARAMLVDGKATTVDEVLADPVRHVLLSDEGPCASPRYPRR